MANAQKPTQIVGAGFLFFNDLKICSITRVERSMSHSESVGRWRGHVTNSAHANKDHFLRVRAEELTADAYAMLSGRCAAFTDLATPPASVLGTATFQHLESLTLADSATADTLSASGATGVQIFKRDFSVNYTQGTDYTLTSSEVTLIGGGSIADGQHVFASYKHVDASAINAKLGDGVAALRGSIRAVIIDQDTGKLFMFEHTLAKPIGDLSVVIEHGADWGGSDVEFRLLYDMDADYPYGRMAFGSAAVASITS